MATVAFIGLGVMGYPMAGHLKSRGGHDVTVFNRSSEKAKKWAEQFGAPMRQRQGKRQRTKISSFHVLAMMTICVQ